LRGACRARIAQKGLEFEPFTVGALLLQFAQGEGIVTQVFTLLSQVCTSMEL